MDTRATFIVWWNHEPQAAQDEWYTLFQKSDPEPGGYLRYGMWLIGDHVEVCTEAPNNPAQNCLNSTEALEVGGIIWRRVTTVRCCVFTLTVS